MIDMEQPKIIANSYRKRMKVLLVVALVGVALWLAGANMGGRGSSEGGIQGAMAQTMGSAGRALASFLGRSPGERGATDILKGKARLAGLGNDEGGGGDTPSQRALGKIFDGPADAGAPQPVVVSFPDGTVNSGGIGPDLTPVVFSPNVAAPSPGPGGGFGGGNGGGGGIGGIGGGGGGGGGTFTPPPAALPVSAVPEPSAWLLMILGFGAIGASLRRGKAISRRAGHCATS